MILESVENGPLIWPTVEENGLLADIYSLVNHHRVSKDLRERVQLLMQDSGFAVFVFSPRDDTIACLNKAMAFLIAVASLRGDKGTINLVLLTRVMLRAQGENTTIGQERVVKCYNCQGEGHMARQYTQPKRQRNAAWYKKKAMLAEAQEAGQILDEQLVFLTDLGILAGQAQAIIPHNDAFQTEHLDTYDSDCDDLLNAQPVLMANISNYGFDVILEETVQDTNLQVQQDSMIFSVIEQMINHVNNWEKVNKEHNQESIIAELERYKERVKTFEQLQTSGSGNTFLLVVAFFFRQWEVPSGSGNFLTSSGNALCILFPTILP
nr:hypothetical protein [Tanacetum cinerariifolium]